MESEAYRLVHDIAGPGEQAPLNWLHLDDSHELEDEATGALEDVIDNEACLACDVLDLLNSQDIDEDQPSSHPSDYGVDGPTPASTATSNTMIERELWLSDSNPVGTNVP